MSPYSATFIILTPDGMCLFSTPWPHHALFCPLFHAVDFEAVRKEGQVPILWSELWSPHHCSQGSCQQGLTTPTPSTTLIQHAPPIIILIIVDLYNYMSTVVQLLCFCPLLYIILFVSFSYYTCLVFFFNIMFLSVVIIISEVLSSVF